MYDQLKIGDKASFDDFSASVAARVIRPPSKKSIKETVPFSNTAYDFSAINGELYWDERELEYTFEIVESTPYELEKKKTAFSSWIMNVFGEKIFDPFIEDYHFIGTYDKMDVSDEDSKEKTTITVTFLAYPHKIANDEKKYERALSADEEVTVVIENNSSHRITPTITTDASVIMVFGDANYSVSAGTYTDEEIKLGVGEIEIVLRNISGDSCNVSISFYEEVF